MATIAEIQNAVIKLPEPEYKSFLKWFEHFEEEKWDRELESHINSGKCRLLDPYFFLIIRNHLENRRLIPVLSKPM